MTIQLPESLTYGKVVGRFLRAVGDTSADVDNAPDGVAATGSVIFTPALVVSKEPANDPQTAVIRDQIPAVLDSQGYLTDPAGNRGIWLVAGVYKVAYNIAGVTIQGHNIEVLASHTELAPLRLIANMTSSGAVLTVSQYSELSGRIDTLNTVSVDIDGTPIVGTDRLVTETALEDLNSTFARFDSPFKRSAGVLRHRMATNQNCVWTHLGDSTANGPDEWLRLALPIFAADYPNMRVTHELWDDSTQGYAAATVVQPGTPIEPPPIIRDTFTRTGTISGSAADTGQVWIAGSGNLNGSTYAYPGTGATIPHGTDIRSSTQGFFARLRATIAPANIGANIRVGLLGEISSANEMFAGVNIGNGSFTTDLYWRDGSTNQMALTGYNWAAWDSVNGDTLTLEMGYKNGLVHVLVTVGSNGQTIYRSGTPTIRVDWPGWNARNLRISGGDVDLIPIDFVEFGLQGTAPTLRVINGSHPGANLSYINPRAAIMAPVEMDLLTIASSHNHGSQDVATFLDQVDALAESIKTRFPDTTIALVSQNPQFAPVAEANRNAHYARLAALRPHAETKGWGYIAGFERFVVRADRGQSWVMADGVHPDAANGSPAWRDAALAYLRSV